MKINILITIIILSAISVACTGIADEPPVPDTGEGFSLRVAVPLADVGSRAPADDPLNEYRVESLHLYFFRLAGHDDATSEYLFYVRADETFSYARDIRCAFPSDALDDDGLFGTDADRCLVYAVANVDENLLTAKTVAGLKATAIGSGFDRTVIQPRFAMDGTATITLDRASRLATGTVTLQRAAAKLTLAVDLPSSIDVEETVIDPFDGTETVTTTTYFSRADQMHVWLYNGVKTSAVNTEPAVVDADALYSNEITNSLGNGSDFAFSDSQSKYNYLQNIPFYSYPNKWDPYSPQGNSSLTLVVPWYYIDGDGNVQNIVTYYRLNVQPNKNFIARNMHYDMRISISRLGGTSVQEPVDMLFNWDYAMEWNVQTLPTDIKEIRYLLLNNNDFDNAKNAYVYTLDNERAISIPFSTSHPVKIASVQLTWRDYAANADRSVALTADSNRNGYSSNIDGYASATDFAAIEIDGTASTLEFLRDIIHIAWSNNRAEIQNVDAMCAYTFTIELQHIDGDASDPSTHATVTITQIPAIYITTQRSTTASQFINNNNTTYQSGGWWGGGTTYGYIGNNAPSGQTQRNYWLGSRHTSGINNYNNYILTISKFDTGDDYIIADPRKRAVDNLNESGSATATATWTIERNNHRLTYYYPADDSDTKMRYIAPQLRVASQCGITYQVYRRGAQRRCATYQENGRPAGRWRLPTVAELEFICRLSNQGYIPYLFGERNGTADYWCASGGVDVDNTVGSPSVTVATNIGANDTRYVRCVYDEWYWGTDTLTNKNTFTWGDRARSTSGN